MTLPVGVGFGIRDAATPGAVAEVADAVVIGSRSCRKSKARRRRAPLVAGRFIAEIRAALDA